MNESNTQQRVPALTFLSARTLRYATTILDSRMHGEGRVVCRLEGGDVGGCAQSKQQRPGGGGRMCVGMGRGGRSDTRG